MKKIIFTLSFVAISLSISIAQNKWSTANPGDSWNFKNVTLSTNEGTWMSVDISPDRTKIVFDLLGDIYTMPVEGGIATPLRTGLPYEVQPRFSPDGSKILFTSDAGGGDNIWVMNSNGGEAKQITKENFRLLNNATWTPDGQYIIARKHFTSGRSLGAGEMWMYHITGGSGIQLTKRKNDQQDVNEPSVSPDGKYLYYSEDMYPGGYFQYNKDPNNEIYAIKRLDLETGETNTITGGNGSASRPVISRDGSKMAFVRRVRKETVLFIRDLTTGTEIPVCKELDKDQMEAWAIFGTYPNFNWNHNDTEIIMWMKGKIYRLNIKTGELTNIPFQVNSQLKIADALHFKNDAYTPEFKSKAIRNAVTSPDGKWMLFSAAGHIYKKKLPFGEPERVTNSNELEFEPSFAADGKIIAYVTWNDETKGAINIYEWQNKKAQPVKLTIKEGIYRTPSFSKDGKMITFVREDGNINQGPMNIGTTGIYLMSVEDRREIKLIDNGEFPTFNKSNDRIFYQSGRYLTKELKSVNLSGGDGITHVSSSYGTRIIPSFDEKWVAFINLHNVYVAPFPKTGKPLELTPNGSNVPVTQLTKDAGINVHWSGDSKKILWTLGSQYFSKELVKSFTFLPNSPDSLPAIETSGTEIDLILTSDKPSGRIAFVGATIITMKGDEVINNGTILVNENKIEAIGSNIQIPSGVKIINVEGKTIIPGLIDVHAHVGHFRDGLNTQNHWQYYANLAYGVTTTHDPSSNTEMVFSQSEMVKSGEMVGPRVFSTGTILYGAEGDFKSVVNNIDDARAAIRRTKAFGAFSVKSYNQPRREQRQQIIQAAREEQVLVVPEGGSTFFHNMSMIFDGHTGIEHNIPVTPVYKDVLTLWGNSKTGYTPTLIVNYGGLSGENYWYQNSNVWENERLLTFTPRFIIDERSRHRTMAPLEEYENGYILTSKTANALKNAGVKVNMGAHGQLQGLGAHWETWMLQQGGMTNLEALRSATMNGAEYLGMDHQIGSLEIGKLADLVVLEENPLDNIQNTNSVIYTMVNGRMYDASNMNEVGNRPQNRIKFWWELSDYPSGFDWHMSTQGITVPKCSCETH